MHRSNGPLRRDCGSLPLLVLTVAFILLSGRDIPAAIPHDPTPANGATNVQLNAHIIWHASGSDNDGVTYDLYLGKDPSPALLLSNYDSRGYYPQGLEGSTKYYWKVVARDPGGAESEGPVWTFTTRENLPPNFENWYSPADGAVNVSVLPKLDWQASDPEVQQRTYDVYFGTDPTPPLVKSGLTAWGFWIYQPLPFSTKYYWRIVVRDQWGLEASSPTLSFTTGGNNPPSVTWDSPRPADKGYGSLNPELFWISYDPDGQATTDSLFFGTAEPLPLIATGIGGGVGKNYSPGLLQTGTKYYWRVVTSDGELSSKGKTWSFTAIPTLQGDINFDGVVTPADAACALETFLQFGPDATYSNCAPVNGAVTRADVNCDQKLTPRDARCIHKNALDGSCSFCTGNLVTAAAARRFTPVVTKDSAWIEWDTLIVRLAVSGVPSLQSFGFHSLHQPSMYLVRAARYGASSSSSVLAERSFNDPMNNNGEVAGYWFDQVDATSPVGFIELRYYLPNRHADSIEFSGFVDDLEGAADVLIDGDTVPVLFTSFSATPIAGGIDVRWQLVSDEAMESYSLYRRDGISSPARLITQGPVQSARGSYLDRSVQAGSSYRYELMVKTTGGDIFRSPVATAALPAVQLALYQNTPNPFNPQTTIRYDLPGNGSTRVRLWILDVGGRMVRTLVDEDQPPGTHEITWNGTNSAGKGVSSGVYFSVLDVDRERRTRKILLLK